MNGGADLRSRNGDPRSLPPRRLSAEEPEPRAAGDPPHRRSWRRGEAPWRGERATEGERVEGVGDE